jgi:hypothetical protein
VWLALISHNKKLIWIKISVKKTIFITHYPQLCEMNNTPSNIMVLISCDIGQEREFLICSGGATFISGDAPAPPHIYNFAPTMLLYFYLESPQFSVLHLLGTHFFLFVLFMSWPAGIHYYWCSSAIFVDHIYLLLLIIL